MVTYDKSQLHCALHFTFKLLSIISILSASRGVSNSPLFACVTCSTEHLGVLRFPFGLVWLSPHSRNKKPCPGGIFVTALGRIRAGMVDGVLHLSCLRSCTYGVMTLSFWVLRTSDYLLPAPVLVCFFHSLLLFIFFYIRCRSRAIWRYPVDSRFGEIQFTNYACPHDMICYNLNPLLVYLFLLFLSRVRRICWAGLGWHWGHRKWRGKPHTGSCM